jgi:hypothetical protein
MIRTANRTESGPQLSPGEERRRSQRVTIRVPVMLHLTVKAQGVAVPAETISVNDHGAMLVCARDLPTGTRLDLENLQTNQRRPASVARAPREVPEGYLLPVAFEKPATGFWQISFPPTDWKPIPA